jgi:PKD repeat protein
MNVNHSRTRRGRSLLAALVMVACTGAEQIANPQEAPGTAAAAGFPSTMRTEAYALDSILHTESFGVDAANASPQTGFTSVCAGTVCVYEGAGTLNGLGVTRWEWSWGDGSSLVRTNPVSKKIFPAPGIYSVTLVVTNSAGDTESTVRADTLTAEPFGMTRLAENNFTCLTACQNGWSLSTGYPDAAVIVRDPTAPKGDSSVMQQNFASILAGGSSPATIGAGLSQKQTVYVTMWMKMSDNYLGHPTGINKAIHFWTRGRNIAVFIVRGTGSGPLVAAFNLQGLALPFRWTSGSSEVVSTEANLLPNVNPCPVTRGKWHRYEMLLSNNSPGAADGRIQYWLDGVKCGDFDQIGFVPAGQNNKWEEISWSPTWGGVGGNISESFFVQMDNLYVSGK